MIVVDASLAAKWLFEEAESEAAKKFAIDNAGRICGPDLLFTEVAGVAVRRANIAPELLEHSHAALGVWTAYWRDGFIDAHRVTPDLLHDAAMLAITMRHPLPDCVYLALADALTCELATCDRKFAARAARLYPRIRLLEDYG